MNRADFLYKTASWGFAVIAISSVATYIQAKSGLPFANTFFWWAVHSLFLGLIIAGAFSSCVDRTQRLLLYPVMLYLVWNIFSTARGCFVAETYWDWKGLISNTLALLLPFIAYVATDLRFLRRGMRLYIWIGLPLFFVVAPLVSKISYGFYLMPVSFLSIFFPVLPRKGKIIILLFIFIVATATLDARSSVIKFTVPFIFSLSWYLRGFITRRLLKIVCFVMMLLPLVFFALGISGKFNIFMMDSYIGRQVYVETEDAEGEINQIDLFADTRTFLYKEVLSTARLYNSWLFGRSPARGNISHAFGKTDPNGRGERLVNEVAVLNIFTWTGIIGVLLYAFVFFRASFLAVTSSGNYFCRLLGLFVAFRWAFSWVEDVNNFTLNTIVLWSMIGLCFSSEFRALTQEELEQWLKGIFHIPCRFVWVRPPVL